MSARWGWPILVVVLIAGCGSAHTITDTMTRTDTVTRTATVTRTTTIVRNRATRRATRVAQKPLTDSGSGTEEIAMTIAVPSMIEWTTTGSFFDMSGLAQGDTADVAITSSASAGVSAVSPGTYPSIMISTDGNWTIKIVAD